MSDPNRQIPHSKPWISQEDHDAVDAVLRSGMIAQGPVVSRFEAEIARYLGVRSGVAVSNGTAALVLALQAVGVAPGDEVILPTYVCRNVLQAVQTVQAQPVLCDIGEHWVATAEAVAPLVSGRTSAIIAVHVFGLPVDVASLRRFGVPIIEDACQAFGLEIGGTQAGSLGDVGVLSFHATKCLTTGEGGMVVARDEHLLSQARTLREGSVQAARRIPAPLSDLQAALGLSQLSRYDAFLRRRRALRSCYNEHLSRFSELRLPDSPTPFLFRFPVRLHRGLDAVHEAMSSRGVHVRRGVDELLHRLLNLPDERFPSAVRTYTETVSIPYYPALSDEDCGAVLQAMEGALEWMCASKN